MPPLERQGRDSLVLDVVKGTIRAAGASSGGMPPSQPANYLTALSTVSVIPPLDRPTSPGLIFERTFERQRNSR